MLTDLNLSYNQIRDEGAPLQSPRRCAAAVLTQIVLGGNNLGDEGKGVIRDAVSGRVGFDLKR